MRCLCIVVVWLLLILPMPSLAGSDPVGMGSPGQAGAPLSLQEKALHVLGRLGYGPRPGDLQRVQAQGPESYVLEQLDRAPADPPELTKALAELPTPQFSVTELFQTFGPPAAKRTGDSPEARQQTHQRAQEIVREAQLARLLRAYASPRQLEEVLVEFWFDHFNVFAGKGLCHLWVGAYEREAIRPYALGRFRDLLGATAKHPAMLFYLDNWLNTAPGSRGARGQFTGLNENYARELLELHTLGVDGGYTQADVTELTRVLTGWGFTRDFRRGVVAFGFDPARHDFGTKHVLGRTFAGGGQAEGEAVLDMLARHPATARHICTQLAQRFVNDDPDPALVARLAKVFLDSDGNLRAVLRALFQDPEFWTRRNFQAKFKSPYRHVVSMLRAAGQQPGDRGMVFGLLGRMGQPLYGCLTPDGYKDTRAAWLNPGTLVERKDLAMELTSRPWFGRGTPEAGPLDVRLETTLGPAVSPQTLEIVHQAPPELRAAALLGGPDFMRY